MWRMCPVAKLGEDRNTKGTPMTTSVTRLLGLGLTPGKTRGLAPLASAILVDGYYGAWNAMASMALPRNTGLLVRVEKSGGGKNKVGAPLGCFEPGLGVRKIKLMGCDAVKLLAPFEPTEPASGEHQLHFVQQ